MPIGKKTCRPPFPLPGPANIVAARKAEQRFTLSYEYPGTSYVGNGSVVWGTACQ